MAKIKLYTKYPIEYFAAQIMFAKRLSEVSKMSIIEACKKYTDLYGAITNHTFADHGNYWVLEIIKEFENLLKKEKEIEKLIKAIYKLFLRTERTQIEIRFPAKKEKFKFGCFRINYNTWHKSRKQIRLHFSPIRQGLFAIKPEFQKSDLSSIYYEDRINEFIGMLKYIKENEKEFKGVKYFASCSWLQSMPVYQSFFPLKYRRSSKHRKTNYESFQWIWGQFIKWDFSGNEERVKEFEQKLKKAKTLKGVFNSIPLPVIELKVPLKEMLEFYGL